MAAHGDTLRATLGDELNRHVHELGALSNGEGYMERFFLTPAWFQAQGKVVEWMKDAGLDVWMDAIGNVHGRTKASINPTTDEPVLMLGSHVDSVRDGGKYDGHLGVVTGIAAVKAAVQLAEATGTRLVRPLHVVSFGDEEGTRFFSGFLSSRALAGALGHEELASLIDADGVPLLVAVHGMFNSTYETISRAAADPSYLHGFVELHIEQGPVLEAMNLPVGAIEAIIGSRDTMFEVYGKQGHAGTSRMDLRADATMGAMEAVLFIERLCAGHPRGAETMLVCTVARLEVRPGVPNVISGDVTFTTDIRCLDAEVLEEVHDAIYAELRALSERRGLAWAKVHTQRNTGKRSIPMDPGVTARLVEAGERASLLSERIWGANAVDDTPPARGAGGAPREVPVLLSGAGHDAEIMTRLTPRVGMFWVRCRGGVSHAPAEFVEERDVAEGGAALFEYLIGEVLPSLV